MEPNTISEKLMFTTIRLVASDGSSGTGFFFNFEIDGMIVQTIITNKHVVKNNSSEIMTFHLHLRTDKSSSDESLKVTFNTFWHFHSKYDLCFCFVNPLFEQIRMQTQKEVFYTANDESIIASSEKLSEFSATSSATERASTVLATKMTALNREADPRKRRDKAYRFLASRGFNSEAIRGAMEELDENN